jgi:hypothetical protein
MNLKSPRWYPVALGLSALNLIGLGAAAAAAEPLHAAAHVGLALGFGFWAQRLRRGTVGGEIEARLEVLEVEVGNLRAELSEAQERLDFAERVLAQNPDARRLGQEG